MNATTCPVCDRDFLFDGRCPFHCAPKCCRAVGCNYQPKKSDDRFCRVCDKPVSQFRRFPSEIRLNTDPTLIHHPRAWYDDRGECYFRWGEGKPVIHQNFCSERCYCHDFMGHLARVQVGRRRRKRMAWNRFMQGKGRNPYGRRNPDGSRLRGPKYAAKCRAEPRELTWVRTSFGKHQIVPRRLAWDRDWVPPESL